MLERVWRKGNSPTLLMGIWIGIATMENSMEVYKKTKSCHMIQQSHSWAFFQKKTIIQKDTCTPMWTAALSTRHGKTSMSIDGWIKKMRYNGILLSHKKNEIIPFAAIWMNLEIITLSEGNQEEDSKYHIIPLICGF